MDWFRAACLFILLVLLLISGFAGSQYNAANARQQTDSVRHSAAVVGAKVERWPELEDRFFEDLQVMLVDVSEKVAETHATEPANRILFKGLAEAKGKS